MLYHPYASSLSLRPCVLGSVVFPPALESKLKQAGSWKNLEEMHKYCRGLEWDANLLARISYALEVTKITELYEEDEDDYYTSELAEAYLDDNDFTDDESTDRSDSIGSKDGDSAVSLDKSVPQQTSESDAVTAAAAASVPLHGVVPGTDDVEGESELAEAKTDPSTPVQLRLQRSNSTAAMCTLSDCILTSLCACMLRNTCIYIYIYVFINIYEILQYITHISN